jgi:RTX calcium-binding nonapeptide repeat (4 copies)
MGDDVIRAGTASDLLSGTASDLLSGGLGSDLMLGGLGIDSADFSQDNRVGPNMVDLGAGTAMSAGGSDVLVPGTIENALMTAAPIKTMS